MALDGIGVCGRDDVAQERGRSGRWSPRATATVVPVFWGVQRGAVRAFGGGIEADHDDTRRSLAFPLAELDDSKEPASA